MSGHITSIKGNIYKTDLINGKSAYYYAVEAGFRGTEDEFSRMLINSSVAVDEHTEEINYLDKRVTNLEQTFSDEWFVTGSKESVAERAVPANALPYAEVKTLAGGFTYTGGKIYPKKPLRVESCKRDEEKPLDLTLDLSEMSPDMTVEKLADGSFKFNGFTGAGSNAAHRKFATVELPAGSYGIKYEIVSGSLSLYAITANDVRITTNVSSGEGFFVTSENETLTFAVYADEWIDGAIDAVVSFNITKGYLEGNNFIPDLVPFATLEIPEEIRNIDGYGLYINYLDFETKQLVILHQLNEEATAIPPLPTPKYIDVSEYLKDDNLIKVVPGGAIKVIDEAGAAMSCKSEVVFMVKGA